MNCREFERLLPELIAKKESCLSGLEKSVQGHAKHCPRCMNRLLDEQALRMGLHRLALDSLRRAAPPRVEENLRQRIQAMQMGALTSSAAVDLEIARVASDRPGRKWWRQPQYLLVGAAAAVVIIASSLMLLPTGPIPQPRGGRSLPSEIEVGVHDSNRTGLQVSSSAPRAEHLNATPFKQSTGRRVSTTKQRRPGAKPPIQFADSVASSGTEELQTSNFLPLFAVAEPAALNQNQIVRVKLPRSALYPFGLPMNMDRAQEPVQADVLLGEDGVAVAVRFVH